MMNRINWSKRRTEMDLPKRPASNFPSKTKLVTHTSLHQPQSRLKRGNFDPLSETNCVLEEKPLIQRNQSRKPRIISRKEARKDPIFAKLGLKQGKTEEPYSHLLPSSFFQVLVIWGTKRNVDCLLPLSLSLSLFTRNGLKEALMGEENEVSQSLGLFLFFSASPFLILSCTAPNIPVFYNR